MGHNGLIKEDDTMLKDVSISAAALYDGGWRSTDAEELKTEYDLTDDEVRGIVDQLKEYAGP